MKIAIYGGSFDPVHNGHVDIANRLMKFDKVIVLPCYVSPFKQCFTDTALRLQMLNLAMPKGVEISNWEIERNQVSYTYQAAMHFSSLYPQDELYFVLGSDSLAALTDWNSFENLVKIINFYVVPRPNSSLDMQANINELKRFGTKITVAPFTGLNVSSSLVRVAASMDKLDELVPTKVAKFVKEKQLYLDYSYITSRFREFGLKQSRIDHVYRACVEAINLAKINNVLLNDAIVATLLHDIGKYIDIDRAIELGMNVSQEVRNLPKTCVHSAVGVYLANKYFDVHEKHILDAIDSHTTADANMSRLAEIVYLSDYIESERKFNGLDSIRKIVYEDLDRGMLSVLDNTLEYFHRFKITDISPRTMAAYEYYKQKLR